MMQFINGDKSVIGIMFGNGEYIPDFWTAVNRKSHSLVIYEAYRPVGLGNSVKPEDYDNASPVFALGFGNLEALNIVQNWINILRKIIESEKPDEPEAPPTN